MNEKQKDSGKKHTPKVLVWETGPNCLGEGTKNRVIKEGVGYSKTSSQFHEIDKISSQEGGGERGGLKPTIVAQ